MKKTIRKILIFAATAIISCDISGNIVKTQAASDTPTRIMMDAKVNDPILVSFCNSASGVYLKWGGVKGATSYEVYRKTGSGSYSKILSTKGYSYVDTTAKAGNYYTYKIKAVAGTASSTGIETKTILRLTEPEITINNIGMGFEIKWDAVKGAKNYIVYKKVDGKWARFTSTTDTRVIDSSVKDGAREYYTVRAVSNSNESSVCPGKSYFRLKTPGLSIRTISSGEELTWSTATGATGYYVYKRANGGAWKKVSTVSTNKYLDKNVYAGTKYEYTVKAYNEYAVSCTKSWPAVMYFPAPVVTSLNGHGPSEAIIKWNSVTKASGYEIRYGKKYDMSDAKTVTSTANAKTIFGLTENVTCYIQMRAYGVSGGTKYYGGWSGIKAVTPCAYPIKQLTPTKNATYTINKNGAITSIKTTASTLILPKTVNGITVIRIDRQCKVTGNIKTLVLPSTMTYGVNNEYHILDSVETIVVDNENAKAGMFFPNLKTIMMTNNVRTVLNGFCKSNPKLETVMIGNNVTYIESYAFSDLKSLRTLYIPKNVKKISAYTVPTWDRACASYYDTYYGGNPAQFDGMVPTLTLNIEGTTLPVEDTDIGVIKAGTKWLFNTYDKNMQEQYYRIHTGVKYPYRDQLNNLYDTLK